MKLTYYIKNGSGEKFSLGGHLGNLERVVQPTSNYYKLRSFLLLMEICNKLIVKASVQ